MPQPSRIFYRFFCFGLGCAAGFGTPPMAYAASQLDGSTLRWPWALPFAGLLLSIALGPLLTRKLWHAHYGKIALAWSVMALAPLAAVYGMPAAFAALVHALLGEYLSFIVVLGTLYVVAGGILVSGTMRGTPLVNTAMLAFGTLIASIVGTTGAAMILIRPLLRANALRPHNVHVVIFFIFLVANIGGALSPLGDPPLFVGFLRGIDFFWTTMHLLPATAMAAGLVLAIFVLVDLWFHRLDRRAAPAGEPLAAGKPAAKAPVRVRGLVNLPLIALIIGAMLVPALWKPNIAFDVYGTRLELQNIVRDVALVVIALASLVFTPDEHRQSNGFTWEPIVEVAKLFAAIFVAIIPVLAMLQAGRNGSFAWLIAVVTGANGESHDTLYFWLTGALSALLDNAPTYLVFFELAGADPAKLMGQHATTLAAISMGAVYMGALTYIGNAPNFMIYAIAEERGIRMPSFFAYMFWATLVLVPVFVVVSRLVLP